MRKVTEIPTAMLTLPSICSGILPAFFRDWSREPPSYHNIWGGEQFYKALETEQLGHFQKV